MPPDHSCRRCSLQDSPIVSQRSHPEIKCGNSGFDFVQLEPSKFNIFFRIIKYTPHVKSIIAMVAESGIQM